MLALILLVFALVLLIVSGVIATPEPWRWRLLCFGLACWVGAEIVSRGAPLVH